MLKTLLLGTLALGLCACGDAPSSGAPEDANDESLGTLVAGKADSAFVAARALTLRPRYAKGPSIKQLSLTAFSRFEVALAYAGDAQTRIVVLDRETGTRVASPRSTQPSLAIEAAGEPHRYRIQLEHHGAAELPVQLSVLPAGPRVELQLLDVSDWHAQLDPPLPNQGGAAVLSSYFQRDRAASPATLTLTAGDAFGAAPPLSSMFDERPAVQAMARMGFDADGLGNHNFDRGTAHLQGLIDAAPYPFLSANLERADENLVCPSKPSGRCVLPYRVFERGGIKVAVVGVTNPDAMSLVKPGNFGTIQVTDPVRAAQKAREQAAGEGAQVFVLIAHMGVVGTDAATGQATGPLVDLARGVRGFDVILGDHTNQPFAATVADALVVENRSFGVTYARVKLSVDQPTGFVLARAAEIVTPVADQVALDPAIVDLLAPYRADLARQYDRPVGVTTALLARGNNIERLGEVPLGDLVADSLRQAYGTQLGFTSGGGLRAGLPSSYVPMALALRRPATGYAAGPPYDLVIGDIFTVLPFGNVAITRTVTGEQLWRMMEHSVEALPAPNGWFGQISGFRCEFDSSRPAGTRVLAITLDDSATVAADGTRYTLATSDFIDTGGDGYTMLVGSDGVSRDKMADVLLAHIERLGTVTPSAGGRLIDRRP